MPPGELGTGGAVRSEDPRALARENHRLRVELRTKGEELRTVRARLLAAGEQERRRLERDLHDGAQQRLVSLALSLRLARERLGGEDDDAAKLLDFSRDELDRALGDLRELARGIHPRVLAERGLGPALEALAGRAPFPVDLRSAPGGRLPEHVEQAAYFVVSEALTNAAKHASANRAEVVLAGSDGRLTIEVGDDGIGGARLDGGSGLRGLADRVAAFEGRLEVESRPGVGTRVRAEIPYAA
jgi:signal transduction histidine kinase